MPEVKMWMVRAAEDGRLFSEFKNKNIVAIRWSSFGDLSSTPNSAEIKRQYKSAYPNASEGQINMGAAQVAKFRFKFKIGDYVITYNPETRIYLIGQIKSDYKYNNALEYKHTHEVSWLKEIPRDALSVNTKNSLSATSTIFEVPLDARREILAFIDSKYPEKRPETVESNEEIKLIKEDFEEKAREFIKDKIASLDWEEMQELVAGLLRAMGYKTNVVSKGPDRGTDIRASPDGLGLQDPAILIQVKHRVDENMDAGEIRNFIGVLRAGKRGLYVSTGGFSKEAKYEAERASVSITLIDLEELTKLVINNYDKFDSDAKALLPLAKIYWPK